MPEYKRASGKGEGKEDEISSKETGTRRCPEHSPPPSATAAIEEEDDDDDDQPALPRTKSQLSMLIDKERKYSGSASLGPGVLKQENQTRKGSGKDDEDEGNELLVMARRDKKGKAKDPDQPFRAAAKKGLWKRGGGDDEAGDGPGSPPPVF
jgi:hypothetical protein